MFKHYVFTFTIYRIANNEASGIVAQRTREIHHQLPVSENISCQTVLQVERIAAEATW